MSVSFEPEIVVLYCRNSTDGELGSGDAYRSRPGVKARLVVVPCSSKVEVEYLVKILEQGADGIHLVGCPRGLCQFLVGNTKAEKRIKHVRGLLKEIDFGQERVGMTRASGLTTDALLEIAEKRARAVSSLGPNPMKK